MPPPCSQTNVDTSGSRCTRCIRVQELEHELRVLKANINEDHDLLRQLPLEIIDLIFTLCLPPCPTLDNYDKPASWCNEGTVYQLNFIQHFRLGSICRLWRTILYSDPRYWNVFYLSLTTTSRPSCVAVFEEWIGRSGDLPLSIHIKMLDTDEFNIRVFIDMFE